MAELISMVFPFVILFAIMYFMIIRPQKKREKLTKQMLDGLVVGDKILTIGGIIGKIVTIKDDTICVETGKAGQTSTITFKRSSVSEVLKAAPDAKQDYDDQYAIPTEEKTEESKVDETDEPVADTDAPQDTDAATTPVEGATASENQDDSNENGCKSVVTYGMAGIVALAACLFLKKKKES